MSRLVDALLTLPIPAALLLTFAAIGAASSFAGIVAFVAYRAGFRHAIERHNRFVTKRRELASIQV